MKNPKVIKKYTNEGFNTRLKKLKDAVNTALLDVDNSHVKIQKGNAKTGINCWTVSLMPVIDCKNCTRCKMECYDFWHDMRYPAIIKDRARNSAIHKVDPKRYWREIDAQIKANFITELRINVGGDLNETDFEEVARLGRRNPTCDFLFFTKNYDDMNRFLEKHRFPKNVHAILSAWKGIKMDNPYNLPESHVLYADNTTTAPEYGAVYCGGNCSECHFSKTERGCWGLKKGEHVIFSAH